MSFFNILTDESIAFQFPTVLKHDFIQTSAKYQNENKYYSKNNIFINNGNTFNSKYIIEHFKKTLKLNINEIIDTSSINHYNPTILSKIQSSFATIEKHKIINETTLIENIHILSSIGLLTKKQYKEFLIQPTKIKKINYLRNNCGQLTVYFKPHLMPLQRPTIKLQDTNKNHKYKIIVTLDKETLKRNNIHHLKNCEIIEKNKFSFVSELMQCSVIIFDVTNDSESELQQARNAFNYIYNELMRYTDEEIVSCKRNGIIRKFILVSTVMTFVRENYNQLTHNKYEEAQTIITHHDILERLPIDKYKLIFEFEKFILKSNQTKIKDIFKTYIISTGVIYGHEENAFHNIFANAWNNPEEMYASVLNRNVPVFHVDELAKLLFIVSKYDDCVKDNFILALEQETCGFNNLIKSVCNELCSSNLVLKEDNLVMNQYKFNSFTWDLICSNLIIDPMLDITVPDYQMKHTSIISNMNKITQEFIKTNNLCSLKILISGSQVQIARNIAEQVAQYYQVKLISIPYLINNYSKLLKNHQNKLKVKINDIYEKRRKMISTRIKLTSKLQNEQFKHLNKECNININSLNEPTTDEIMDNDNHHFKIHNTLYLSKNENCSMPSNISMNIEHIYYKESNNELYAKHNNHILKMDEEINNIKNTLENLNYKFKTYENNINRNKEQLDNCYLMSIIKESLSLFSCCNQGYVFELFPLTVEKMELIFNENIGYPSFIVLLSNISNTPTFFKETCSTNISHCNTHLNNYSLKHGNKTNSNNFEYQTYKYNVNFSNSINETNIFNIHDTFENKLENNHNKRHKYKTSVVVDMIKYCTIKNIIILKFNIPFELAKATPSYDLQYKSFLESILSQIGRPSFKHIYKTNLNNEARNRNTTKINEKLKSVSTKLSIMKKQWNNDVIKTLEFKKKKEKSVTIHNFLRTNVLPTLLKVISPVDNGKNLVSQFPEKIFKK